MNQGRLFFMRFTPLVSVDVGNGYSVAIRSGRRDDDVNPDEVERISI
jgi:hypothetical protein